MRRKVRRYRELVPPLAATVVEVVRTVAARVPVAVALGAPLEEVEPVPASAGVLEVFAALVCAEGADAGVAAAGMRSAALSASPAYGGGADHELGSLLGLLDLVD